MRLLGNLCDAFQPAARRLHASSGIAVFAAEGGAYDYELKDKTRSGPKIPAVEHLEEEVFWFEPIYLNG